MASPSTPLNWLRGSLIGAGAFGRVSLAIDIDSGQLFAVKSHESCQDSTMPELLAMENELAILQSLDCPFIVRCLGSDYTVVNGVRMRNMFMEYMPGGSLADVIAKFGGKLEESLIRLYIRDILQGLDYLHGEGIVHCDVKAKNILVGTSGAKLADFGVAKRIGQSTTKLEMADSGQSIKGTILWMAPEVVQQLEQGPASDIWSLGCTILEMATGHPPWSDSPNAFAAIYRIGCTDDLPFLKVSDFLSEETMDFLQNCFQRDPKARWTCSQLLKHPFIMKATKSKCRTPTPSSPTSILDFPEWMDSQCTDSVPVLSLPRRLMEDSKQNQAQSHGNPEGHWTTVRSPEGSSQSHQKPFSDFMLGMPEATSCLVHVKKGCEVNLDCLSFLRNRRHRNERSAKISINNPVADEGDNKANINSKMKSL